MTVSSPPLRRKTAGAASAPGGPCAIARAASSATPTHAAQSEAPAVPIVES
jgi:hypothetical protein